MRIDNVHGVNFYSRSKYNLIPKAELRELMANRVPYEEIGAKYNVPMYVVARSIKTHGLKTHREFIREANVSDIRELYRQGYSAKQIRIKLQVSAKLVDETIDEMLKNASSEDLILNIIKSKNLDTKAVMSNLK